MDNFANIGKAVLTQSLGLQKNFIEIKSSVIDVIDYNTPICNSCKYKSFIETFSPESEPYLTATKCCNECPNKVYTQKTIQKKIYHNEKNRFGYKPRLKSNSIKLLLLLHFYHPDQFGIIRNLNTKELSQILSCDIKTVRNNLLILKNYSYITYEKSDTYMINVCLLDYEKYYLPANKGGRGFFVLSKELLLELINIPSLLSLRIYLREIMDLDNLNAKGPFTAISKSCSEIKKSLPDYCKPGIIKGAVTSYSTIFKVNVTDNIIRFEIYDRFNSKKRKEECFNQYIEQFTSFLSDFNNIVPYINLNNEIVPSYENFFNIPPEAIPDHFRLMKLKDFEIEDLAKLAIQYSYDIVISALSNIYKSYILYERTIINLGGLVRTAIIANLDKFQKAV